MQSFTSKELVKCQFSWRYYYWYLTNEGIEYLREYLNLSADVVHPNPASGPKPLAPSPQSNP
jgi:small subunit ribosomal protein S10e